MLFPDNPPLSNVPGRSSIVLHGHVATINRVWMPHRLSIDRYACTGWPLMVRDARRRPTIATRTTVDHGPAYEDDLMKDVMGPASNALFRSRPNAPAERLAGCRWAVYGAIKLGSCGYPEPIRQRATRHSVRMGMAPDSRETNCLTLRTAVRFLAPTPRVVRTIHLRLIEKIDHGLVPAHATSIVESNDFLLKQNRDFHAKLESLHIPHEYEEFPGGHTWKYWDEHIREAIAFHTKNLGAHVSGPRVTRTGNWPLVATDRRRATLAVTALVWPRRAA